MALGNLLTFYQLQVALTLLTSFFHSPVSPRCRSQLADPLFPTFNDLSQFNDSIDGQLIAIVPSGAYCLSRGGCTEAEWTSSVFRSTIPGAMTNVNWEQNYYSDPNELCFRNSSLCGAGNVPIFGVNASKPEHIQAGIEFARTRNLKLVVKSTGHDFLGRSTAKNSFLLWTRNFRNITFHESFRVGGRDLGSAVTVGSGVPLNMLYQAAKANGKTFVGGTAGTVAPAGGYVQGAGHSALSPIYGLAADNVLEFHIVTPNGDLVTANTESHSDLFWALRGGGPGSWGVVVNATFRTFPLLNASHQRTTIIVNNTEDVRTLIEIHAQHIFDWDDARAAQYFYWRATHHTGGASQYSFTIDTLFPNMSVTDAIASLEPMLGDFRDKGFNFTTSSVQTNINDILTVATDLVGGEAVLASRFWSDDVYRNNVTDIGKVYQTLFDDGAAAVLGHRLLGGMLYPRKYTSAYLDLNNNPLGRVSENANIDSAVHPGWRTAKTHMVITNTWKDTTPSIEVEALRNDLTKNKTPILASLAGPDGGSYSNEGDVREPEFQRVFYGRNYARLNSIKAHYDPHDLFIVPTGVGSERWDSADGTRTDGM